MSAPGYALRRRSPSQSSSCLSRVLTLIVAPQRADVRRFVIEVMAHESEELHVIYLGRDRAYLGGELIARGDRRSIATSCRRLFQGAFRYGAPELVLMHNHPSGDPTPSDADILFTRQAAALGQSLAVELVDHLIVAGEMLYSMAERRQL